MVSTGICQKTLPPDRELSQSHAMQSISFYGSTCYSHYKDGGIFDVTARDMGDYPLSPALTTSPYSTIEELLWPGCLSFPLSY